MPQQLCRYSTLKLEYSERFWNSPHVNEDTHHMKIWLSSDCFPRHLHKILDTYLISRNSRLQFSVAKNREYNNASKYRGTTVDENHSIGIIYALVVVWHVTCERNKSSECQAQGKKHLSRSILPDLYVIKSS